MKNIKITLVMLCITLSSIHINAQINSKPIKGLKKPGISTANFPKMDATVKEIITGAHTGNYKISMAALTLTKYKDTYSSYVGSTSFSTVNKVGKITSLRKIDAFTAEGSFFVNTASVAANVRIFTTKFGGQKMTIRHTEGVNADLVTIKNIKIMKKGRNRYIITGNSEKNGNITTYIFNIYEMVIQ